MFEQLPPMHAYAFTATLTPRRPENSSPGDFQLHANGAAVPSPQLLPGILNMPEAVFMAFSAMVCAWLVRLLN
jgi:hypothetical protein